MSSQSDSILPSKDQLDTPENKQFAQGLEKRSVGKTEVFWNWWLHERRLFPAIRPRPYPLNQEDSFNFCLANTLVSPGCIYLAHQVKTEYDCALRLPRRPKTKIFTRALKHGIQSYFGVLDGRATDAGGIRSFEWAASLLFLQQEPPKGEEERWLDETKPYVEGSEECIDDNATGLRGETMELGDVEGLFDRPEQQDKAYDCFLMLWPFLEKTELLEGGYAGQLEKPIFKRLDDMTWSPASMRNLAQTIQGRIDYEFRYQQRGYTG